MDTTWFCTTWHLRHTARPPQVPARNPTEELWASLRSPRSSQAGEVVLPPRAVCSAHMSWPLSLGAGTFLSVATPSSRAVLLLSLCVDPAVGQRIWKQHGKDPMGEAPGATKTSKHKGLTQQPLSPLPSPCRAWRPGFVHAVFPQSLHTHKMLWCLLVPHRHYKKKGTKDFNSMRHSRTIKSHAAKAMYK